jgi:hypothetical protein
MTRVESGQVMQRKWHADCMFGWRKEQLGGILGAARLQRPLHKECRPEGRTNSSLWLDRTCWTQSQQTLFGRCTKDEKPPYLEHFTSRPFPALVIQFPSISAPNPISRWKTHCDAYVLHPEQKERRGGQPETISEDCCEASSLPTAVLLLGP